MANDWLSSLTSNPKFRQFGSEALQDLGYGLTKGTNFGNALGAATQRSQDLQPQRDAFATQQKAETDRLAQINQTAQFLRSKGAEDLAAAVEGGMTTGADAFNQWYQQSTAQPNLTADMQNYQFAQENPGFADFIGGGQGAATPPQVETRYNQETGQEEKVQWNPQSGGWEPFGGQKMPTARDNPMNSTIQKEIFEADEGVQAGQAVLGGLTRALELNQVAYDGPFADQRSAASALFGDQGGIATQELKNVVTAQALESLKATFGGMPTEGERKILLEIQGSVDQPKPVREAIYRRAMAAAERRIASNLAKAEGLRNGGYFDPGFGQQQQAPGGATSSGLQWSIEP